MLRTLMIAPLAALLCGLLFLGISQLAGLNHSAPERQERVRFQLSPLRFDVAVDTLEQAPPPPPPEPVETPKPPTPELATPSAPPPKITPTVPSIDLKIQSAQVALPQLTRAAPVSPTPAAPAPVAAPTPELSAPSAPAISSTDLLRVDPLVRMKPRYPRRALRRRQSGYVEVEITVDENGYVSAEDFLITASEPEGVFDKAVKKAVLKWRFAPRQAGGQRLAYRTRQRVEFQPK